MLKYAFSNQAERRQRYCPLGCTLKLWNKIFRFFFSLFCFFCNQQLFYNLRSTSNRNIKKRRLSVLHLAHWNASMHSKRVYTIYVAFGKSVTASIWLHVNISLVALLMNKIKNYCNAFENKSTKTMNRPSLALQLALRWNQPRS